MKKTDFLFSRISLAVIVPAILFLFSCTNFFSTSWGAWATRDSASLIPKVTVDNVSELTQAFEDDPDASLELLRKIKDEAANLTGDELSQMQSAALEVAVNSAGLGQAIINAAGNLDTFDDPGSARDILLNAINGMSNLEETGDLLSTLLPSPPSDPRSPDPAADAEWIAFTESATANDLAMAAVVLLLGEASKNSGGNFDDYLDNKIPSPSDPNTTREQAQAMAIVATLGTRVDQVTGPLRNILDHLNLLI